VLHKDKTQKREHPSPVALAGRATAHAPRRDVSRPGARLVRRQVKRILGSADFDASGRSREFLRFIVEETLAGRGEELTQSAIATKVFGRKDDFDAVVDPIVRIQAGRLRRSLERYYLLSGRHDSVHIELPRGGYVPAFHNVPVAMDATDPVATEKRAPQAKAASAAFLSDWPTVAIVSFDSAAGAERVADLVTEELSVELARYHDLRVVLQDAPDGQEAAARRHARFALGGRVRSERGGWQVSARLVDQTTGEQIWGDKYNSAPGAERWSGTPDDIARVIAARVGAEEGIIVQSLAAEHRRQRPAEPTTYEAILRSYDFFLARDPEAYSPAVEALRQLGVRQPECPLVWSRLARLYAANYAFEVTAVPTPIDEAITCAQTAVRLDPTSRRSRCTLAWALLVKGELTAALDELEQALRLSPDSLVYLDMIGFLLTLAGDWKRGPALSRSARERNPYCLPQVVFGLWTDHLRRGDFEAAYQAALEYRDPTFFWRPVMRASCLGHLGRASEANAEVANLLRSRPDFVARGPILLGHIIKFPDVRTPIVEGLAKAGLALGLQ
jgi:adenylate cyclase